MANLKAIKTRIDSVTSTLQITAAMKMVSASKLRKTQNAILKIRPYAGALHRMLEKVSGSANTDNPFLKERPVENVLLIVITSNKGLCGTFNNNILKTAMHRIETYYADQAAEKKVHILAFGRKGHDFFTKRAFPIAAVYEELIDKVNYPDVAEIVEGLMTDYLQHKYDRIDIIYNRFKNAATQIIEEESFLPLTPIQSTQKNEESDYMFLPDEAEVFAALIPNILKTQLFKDLLESSTSEHGARMTAMHKASDNAETLITSLKLSYNKIRQAAITDQLLEIINGAEAMKNR